jgi:DNA-nicking Smr family endonuclease
MKASKSTLADLRRLRAQAPADDPAPPATTPPDPAPPPPELDPDDRALFRQAMRFVQPLTHRGGRARGAAHRDPEALLTLRRAHAQGADAHPERPAPRSRRRSPAALDPDAREFLQPGCGTDLLRGLRRGKWMPEAALDLHGSTEDQAHERLDRFVASCAEHDIRCVRIVHGKGIGSRHGTPVLKSAVRIHLCRLQVVQAWVECAEPDGGAGAVTVLLRAPAESPDHAPEPSSMRF